MGKHSNKIRRLVIMSILLAIALTIFMIEVQIPVIAPIPGIKLGLSNIITLMAILYLGKKEAFSILILRIIIGSIFSGQVISLMYSFGGGILCFIVMTIACEFLKKEYIPLISVLGAIAHNIGQISIAIILINSTKIIFYLPMLLLSGIITGFFTGYIVYYVNNNYSTIRDLW